MFLKIIGCPDPEFKPFLTRSAHYFAEKLFSKQLSPHIFVVVKFDKKMIDHGSCEVTGDNIKNKPREFLIHIKEGLGAPSTFRTMAHELVHVKQFAYGHTNDTLTVWHKKEIDSENLDYWFHPWEIEAYGLETCLVSKFAIKEKLWEVFEEFKNPDDPEKYQEIKWKIS